MLIFLHPFSILDGLGSSQDPDNEHSQTSIKAGDSSIPGVFSFHFCASTASVDLRVRLLNEIYGRKRSLPP